MYIHFGFYVLDQINPVWHSDLTSPNLFPHICALKQHMYFFPFQSLSSRVAGTETQEEGPWVGSSLSFLLLSPLNPTSICRSYNLYVNSIIRVTSVTYCLITTNLIVSRFSWLSEHTLCQGIWHNLFLCEVRPSLSIILDPTWILLICTVATKCSASVVNPFIGKLGNDFILEANRNESPWLGAAA